MYLNNSVNCIRKYEYTAIYIEKVANTVYIKATNKDNADYQIEEGVYDFGNSEYISSDLEEINYEGVDA